MMDDTPQTDRDRWNQRYAEGAYSERPDPSVYLVEQLPQIPRGRALDVACGRGRNAVYLAAQGFRVDAVDVSDTALELIDRQVAESGLPVITRRQDLFNTSVHGSQAYELIILIRFVAPLLVPTLPARLSLGGSLIIEEHLAVADASALSGPRNPNFRVAAGAQGQGIEQSGIALEIVDQFEGRVTEPDGSDAAVARIHVRRTR